MAIPDYQSIMLPLLRFAGDSAEHSFREAVESLAKSFGLTDEEKKEPLASGTQPLFSNRVGWANTYLKKAGLLESSRYGHFRITAEGKKVLASPPSKIEVGFLSHYPNFVKFQSTKKEPSPVDEKGGATPEEALENAYQDLREQLMSSLLEQIKGSSPDSFEKTVVELLVGMGYGGSLKDAGKALGGPGDEGIDGIIKEDRLGLDIIYIQAKRWKGTVGRPEVQKFAGALAGQQAKKGIFITTSDFSKEARDFVRHIDTKIVLVDGEELAGYMIDHDIGVTPVISYAVKRIDLDYFVEE